MIDSLAYADMLRHRDELRKAVRDGVDNGGGYDQLGYDTMAR